jgi:hypothetical protein
METTATPLLTSSTPVPWRALQAATTWGSSRCGCGLAVHDHCRLCHLLQQWSPLQRRLCRCAVLAYLADDSIVTWPAVSVQLGDGSYEINDGDNATTVTVEVTDAGGGAQQGFSRHAADLRRFGKDRFVIQVTLQVSSYHTAVRGQVISAPMQNCVQHLPRPKQR